MAHDITLNLGDEQATLNLGASFSSSLVPGVTVYLHGDLGAGKTTFVRGVLNGLGFTGKVKSPTLIRPLFVWLNGQQKLEV